MARILSGNMNDQFCDNPKCQLSTLFFPKHQTVARLKDALGLRDVGRKLVLKENGKDVVMLCDICREAIEMTKVRIIHGGKG